MPIRRAKPAESISKPRMSSLGASALGQRSRGHGLGQCPPQVATAERTLTGSLGRPMNISEVAAAIGCSVWTIRQVHVPRGLRSSPNGKLIFYESQVVRWIEQQQGG
jgi:hypothetical protein